MPAVMLAGFRYNRNNTVVKTGIVILHRLHHLMAGALMDHRHHHQMASALMDLHRHHLMRRAGLPVSLIICVVLILPLKMIWMITAWVVIWIIMMKRDGIRIAKGLASQRTPYATLLTNNLKQICNKKTKNVWTFTAAKVRGFWADSKKIAWFLSKLLRQGNEIATE